MFLVDILKPEMIVELGTHYGESYCAFCQAVKLLNLDSRCYAIDTWRGDAHSDFYGPEVLADLRDHHDLLYGSFSCLIQSTFEEALDHFGDGTISLLHIDAYHAYESVKRDFDTWLPKMSRNGVILFHDTNVRERDFGVRRFWDEIKPRYQHFEFIHGHGLGVLAVGDVTSSEFQELLDATGEQAAIIRDFFFQLGNRLELKFENANKASALSEKADHISKQQEMLNSLEVELEKDRQIVAEREQAVESLSALSAEKDQALQSLTSQSAEKDQKLQTLASEAAEKDEALQTLACQAEEHERVVGALSVRLNELEQALQALSTQLEEKQQSVSGLRAQLSEKDQTIRALTSQATKEGQVITALSARLADQNEYLRNLSAQAANRDETIRDLLSRAPEQERVIGKLSAQLAEKDQLLRTLISQAAEGRQAIDSLSAQVTERDRAIRTLSAQVNYKEAQLTNITGTLGWRLLRIYGRRIKYPYLLPLYRLYGRIKYPYLLPVYRMLGLMPKPPANAQIRQAQNAAGQEQPRLPSQRVITVEEIAAPPPLEPHRASADVIVCVHNALEDVKQCLESVVRYTRMPYSLVLVDDGSNEETREYLASFADSHHVTLIRNEQARGYTFAANQGLKQSQGDYVVLLNSDTVVTPDWLDRMVVCGESDSRIGMVGPLSNSASWQSIPEIMSNEDWAENRLPEGWTVSDMGRLVAQYSARLYQRMPFLNGFCLMIKRRLIEEIGYFDEEVFGKGYGEENDYCLRAREANWQLAVAEDAYVYHHQSSSYSHKRRKELSRKADAALASKHGQGIISDGVAECRFDRVLQGIRARNQVMVMREQVIEQGKRLWEGKRVLFILPVSEAGGGANVVLDEAEAMRKMGVDARILNLNRFQTSFERSYPDNALPAIYVNKETEIAKMLPNYDAVIATYCGSVDWLEPLTQGVGPQARAYYIQDFEPHFFPDGSAEFAIAWNSYTRYPDLIRITKTEWNRAIIKEKIGVDCTVVSPSVDIDLHCPRRRQSPDWPQRPLRIGAMIRPITPRRAPILTMEVLRELSRARGNTIEVILFGCRSDDPGFLELPRDFPWRNAGLLTRRQVASLMNEIDIFVDFSSFQAMGMTAMEAMCCGVAVLVPQNGGSESFVRHEENGIVVDTSSQEACFAALERLVIDEQLRTGFQRRAIVDICAHFPERAAYNILNTLFQPKG
jgi:GT2 family glycosyltransferase/glycosyltransferase involved in cell wall biosynthesis